MSCQQCIVHIVAHGGPVASSSMYQQCVQQCVDSPLSPYCACMMCGGYSWCSTVSGVVLIGSIITLRCAIIGRDFSCERKWFVAYVFMVLDHTLEAAERVHMRVSSPTMSVRSLPFLFAHVSYETIPPRIHLHTRSPIIRLLYHY